MTFLSGLSVVVALAASPPATITIVDAQGDALENVVLVRFSAEPTATEHPTEHVMAQVNRQFSPQLLVIQHGDSISFPNNDAVRHHVYSFSSPRVFEFELYSSGESPTLDFPEQGVVVVGCNIHDQMEGHIIVGADSFALSNAQGQLQLPANYSDNGEWYLWHGWMLNAGQQPQQISVTTNHVQLDVEAPPAANQSELESRFQRRTLRGGH
ncbi:MAG: hypothetical protein JJU03_02950 [Idiomarina sp.]|nr:hypothetical protein [Idiomarina sp.]